MGDSSINTKLNNNHKLNRNQINQLKHITSFNNQFTANYNGNNKESLETLNDGGDERKVSSINNQRSSIQNILDKPLFGSVSAHNVLSEFMQRKKDETNKIDLSALKLT